MPGALALLHHRTRLLVLLLVLSSAIRIAHFSEIADSPVASLHGWDQSDMGFFHEWGRQLAAGDWLTSTSLHPLHAWHVEVARQYFELRPGLRDELKAAIESGA